MAEEITTCPIWGTSYKAEGTYDPVTEIYYVTDSERAFCGYTIPQNLLTLFGEMLSEQGKARLTTWLVDQWLLGKQQPTITPGVFLSVPRKSLPVYKRADRLLKYLAEVSVIQNVGADIRVPVNDFGAFAWSESLEESEIDYFLDYLVQRGWLASTTSIGLPRYGCKVTVDGHTRIEQLEIEERVNNASSQAFVAMWFHDSTDGFYKNGIEPAILEAGYKPLRIDQKEHLNKIEDEIVAQIRCSKFVVADFTQGDDGTRGGVYYEAGFAHGLGLPVIFTCHADSVKDLHFDTSHYNHLVWNTSDELRDKLKVRIIANIGQGPEV